MEKRELETMPYDKCSMAKCATPQVMRFILPGIPIENGGMNMKMPKVTVFTGGER